MTEEFEDTALINKYRPQSLDDFLGTDALKSSIASVLERETNRPHAIMFHGPAGCGKTTLAYLVAKMWSCSERDFRELNIADFTGVDTVRKIRHSAQYPPLGGGGVKIWLLDEAHRFSPAAQDGLLKLLEKPPRYVFFILCTTNPKKLLGTIRSRCTPFKVNTLQRSKIIKLLKHIIEQEKIADFPVAAYKEIARVSQGSPRTAIAILDSVIDVTDDALLMEAIAEAYGDETSVKELADALINKVSDWSKLSPLLRNVSDPEQMRRSLLGYFTAVLLNKRSDRLAYLIAVFCDPMYELGNLVAAVYSVCVEE